MSLIYENRARTHSAYINNDMSFLTHLHKQAELLYVLDGEIEMTVEKHTCTLRAGQIGLAFPNRAHSYASKSHNRTLLYIFDAALAGDCDTALLTQHPQQPFVTDPHPDVAYLVPQLPELEDLRLIKGYLQIICTRLFETMQPGSGTLRRDDDWTHLALTYLNEHFTESLTLDELAAHLNISKYHLSRSFPERIGCGLNAYINSLRADHAAMLLASTKISVTQVGFDSGFESSSTFFRTFKELYGVSPKQYRKDPQNHRRGG